jgi:hypothetical protein
MNFLKVENKKHILYDGKNNIQHPKVQYLGN